MADPANPLNRRELLTGRRDPAASGPGPDALHVSGAVVVTLPGRQAEVLAALSGRPGIEVHAAERDRIVVTLEGRSTGEMGDRLTAIALLPGVVAANLVFEHSDSTGGPA